jgi:DNA-binding XRE family transcriptional regulator
MIIKEVEIMNIYKKVRINKGLTVLNAANLLKISASHLWNIEDSRRKPGKELIIRMCKLYECRLEDIFFAS